MTKFLKPLILIAALFFGAELAVSGQVSIPYTFTANTTIRASEVNSNFSTLGSNALNRTGGTVTGALASSGGSWTGTWAGSPTLSGNPTFSGTPVFSTGAALAGTFSGTPTFSGDFTVSGAPTFSGNATFSGTTTVSMGSSVALQLGAAGLQLADTNRSHYLVVTPGSDLTANRVLTLTTGDAARTITLSGNPTLNDWFDQAVKTTSTPTFAGATLGATDFNGSVAQRGKLQNYRETLATPSVSSNAVTLDLSTANVFRTSLSASVTTLTISNAPATGTVYSFTWILDITGSRTVTWPASVKWGNAGAPTLSTTNGKVDVFTFVTTDGGTSWLGFNGGQNF